MPTAVIAGVGPGLGESIARRFAAEGCDLGLIARSEGYIDGLAGELPAEAVAAPANLAAPDDIEAAFDRIRAELGPVDVLVNHASAAGWTRLMNTDLDEYDRAYNVGPRAGFLCSREAVKDMRTGASDDATAGTILFTGATTSVRGREGAVGFSMSKFGSRGLAESMC